MKDEKQLVLFFRSGTKVDNTQLADKLKQKFEILGDPIVLPVNQKDLNQPLIIFNQGEINLTVGLTDVSFIYKGDEHKKLFDIVIEIIECIENLDYSFERMGYISTFLKTKKEREMFIEKVIKKADMLQSEFQLSWYKKELIDSVSVNVWQKAFTDMINNIEFVKIFDINTPMGEPYNINSEFLRDFIKACDKYIEKENI